MSNPSPAIISGLPLQEEPGIGPLTLGAYLREVSQRHGDREAIVTDAGSHTTRWSYSKLWAESMTLARALAACGTVKGERVGLLMTNRPEFIAAAFGIALAGGIVVPLSTFSTADELDYLLKRSCCSIVILESQVLKKDFAKILVQLEPALADAAPGAIRSARFPFLRRLVTVDRAASAGSFEGWADFLARAEKVPPALIDACADAIAPSDPAMIFFSSGSTARPKGILHAHRGVTVQFWRWPRLFDLDRDVRCWTANGFFWAGTFSTCVGCAFTAGGTLVLQRYFDPDAALLLMARERVDFPVAWPHQWAKMEESPSWQTVDLAAVRYADCQSPVARHPTVKVDRDDPHAYGTTETFTVFSIYPADTPAHIHADSVGTPLPGNTLKIVDPLSGATRAVGERGEIAVKGPTLMLGYLGRPLDETLDENGFLRTGDGGYVDEHGRLYWEGRLNDIIKTGGANVSPLEVDEVLRSLPGVQAGQTVGVPHETLGELVVSCIVPKEGVLLSAEEIREQLKQRLASYKVPRRVLFFSEEEFAVTGSAKIKTADLRTLVAKRLSNEGTYGLP